MQYGYEKMMDEYDLTYSELPQAAKVSIQAIKKIEKAMNMVEASGKKVSRDTIEKIKANDKWTMNEILDYVHDTDDNDDDMPYDEEEILEDFEGTEESKGNKDVVIPQINLKIEEELKSLYSTGKKKFTIDELGESAGNVYDAIFDFYDADEDNGVQTSNYQLIEKDDNLFHLSKI
jgi:hypothetical protein